MSTENGVGGTILKKIIERQIKTMQLAIGGYFYNFYLRFGLMISFDGLKELPNLNKIHKQMHAVENLARPIPFKKVQVCNINFF